MSLFFFNKIINLKVHDEKKNPVIFKHTHTNSKTLGKKKKEQAHSEDKILSFIQRILAAKGHVCGSATALLGTRRNICMFCFQNCAGGYLQHFVLQMGVLLSSQEKPKTVKDASWVSWQSDSTR